VDGRRDRRTPGPENFTLPWRLGDGQPIPTVSNQEKSDASAVFAVVIIGDFALGAGLTTLVRPHLIQTTFSSESRGYLNGRVARHQQLARAVGPLAIGWLGSVVGDAAAFAVIAGAFTVFALASAGVLSGIRSARVAKEAVRR
jgi:hypothetical protein